MIIITQPTLYADPKIYVVFYCETGVYPVIANRSTNFSVPSGTSDSINKGLTAVKTQNDTQQDLPSATIALTDDYDWATIIAPNDYVEVRVTYRSNIFSNKTDITQTGKLLYNGLVNDIKKSTNAQRNSRTYIVASQGMAKVLQNINLGTFTEITSETVPLLPDEEGSGIAVSGRSSANIINQIFNKFVWTDIIKYHFGISGTEKTQLKDMLSVKDAQGHSTIEANSDEAQAPANNAITFLGNYNGSILQMIKDVASRPFNELYWTHEEGKATFHYRPTKFDEQDWHKLPIINLSPSAIISEDVDINDQEQSSIFKVTPSHDTGAEGANWLAGVAPITHTELIARYGYKIMDVTTDYFTGTTNEDDNSKGDGLPASHESRNNVTENQARLHYPPISTIHNAFAYADKKKGDTISGQITIPASAGGRAMYNKVKKSLSKNQGKEKTVTEIVEEAKGSTAENKLTTDNVRQLYDRYMSQGKKDRAFETTDYLNVVAPELIPTSQKMSKDSKYLKSYATMKKHPKKAAMELIQEVRQTLGSKQAYEIVKLAINKKGAPSSNEYLGILSKYKFNAKEDGVSSTGYKGAALNVPAVIDAYEKKLFNWYADNSKFLSGNIIINGTSGIEIGKRLVIHDTNDNLYWEFYIESVSEDFSYTSGWTTTIGVTRGFPDVKPDGDRRFRAPYSFYGQSVSFAGGYFGEPDLNADLEEAKRKHDSSGDDSADGGADGSGSVSANGVQHWGRNSVPKDVKKYIHDPGKAGLAYGTQGGWYNPGNQCVHFASSYFRQIWNAGPRPMVPTGKQVAHYWASAMGGKTSKTPHAGSVASCPGNVNGISTGGAGHTWVVQHVLSNGDTIIAEQNIPGLSGQGNQTTCTWNFGLIPKSVSDKYITYYTPSKKHKLNWG